MTEAAFSSLPEDRTSSLSFSVVEKHDQRKSRSPARQSVLDTPQQLSQVVTKGPVHEGVDERIGDVVEEEHVEEDVVHGHHSQADEPRRQEGDDEDYGDDKQHGRGLDVGVQHPVTQRHGGPRGDPAGWNLDVGVAVVDVGQLRLFSGCLLSVDRGGVAAHPLALRLPGSSDEDGAVNEGVEKSDDEEGEEEGPRVDLLVHVGEVDAEDELVRDAVSVVHDDRLVDRLRQRLAAVSSESAYGARGGLEPHPRGHRQGVRRPVDYGVGRPQKALVLSPGF